MPIIVDGYNLLRGVQKQYEEFENLSDSRLCKLLCDYLRRVGDNGEIIFDGVGPPDKMPFNNFDCLEVYFVGANTDADSVIEDKIIASSAPKRLVVVSSDRRIRSAASKRKAVSVKSDLFWLELVATLEKPHRKSPEPREKHDGITKGETDRWLDIFGLK